MGKRTRTQRAGKGSPTFSRKKHAERITYPLIQKNSELLRGQIIKLSNDSSHSSVLARVLLENNEQAILPAAEGVFEGQEVRIGEKAELEVGNVLPLSKIVEGCPVFAVERVKGDGGKIARASGLYALVLAKDKQGVQLKLPSGSIVRLKPESRATVGCAAGGGRTEKPFVKAGAKFYKMKARGIKYPTTRGVAMNPLTHPFGGSQHHAGKSKSTSRHAAPGRKVGAIASKRTGRRKKN